VCDFLDPIVEITAGPPMSMVEFDNGDTLERSYSYGAGTFSISSWWNGRDLQLLTATIEGLDISIHQVNPDSYWVGTAEAVIGPGMLGREFGRHLGGLGRVLGGRGRWRWTTSGSMVTTSTATAWTTVAASRSPPLFRNRLSRR